MWIFSELKNILTKSKTLDYNKIEYSSETARGVPVPLKFGECNKCKECESYCPTKAIQINEKKEITLDYGSCIQCGVCVDVCPDKILVNSNFIHVYALNRGTLVVSYSKETNVLGEEVETENVKNFRKVTRKKGFNYREVAAGGNNSVEAELNASFNNVFDSEGEGFRCVASPKHADVLLFSGPVPQNMENPLRIAFECMPEPKALVACGTEAISGGLFDKGNLPKEPDLYIGGDPPRPDVVISAYRFLLGTHKFHFQKALFARIQDLKNAKTD